MPTPVVWVEYKANQPKPMGGQSRYLVEGKESETYPIMLMEMTQDDVGAYR